MIYLCVGRFVCGVDKDVELAGNEGNHIKRFTFNAKFKKVAKISNLKDMNYLIL